MRLNAQGKTGYQDCKGNAPPLPGRYHVAIQDVEIWKDKNDQSKQAVVVEFQVLCDTGTTPGQEGKTHREFFQLNEKEFNVERLMRLAMITGLLKPGEDREVDFRDAKAAQLVIELTEEEYKGQKRARIKGMSYWAIGDQEIRDVPMNEAMLQIRPGSGGTKVATAAAPAPASGGSDWDNL